MYKQLVELKYFPEDPSGVRARNVGMGVGIIVIGAIVGVLWFLFGNTVSSLIILPAIALGGGGRGGSSHTLGEWYEPAGRELCLKRLALITLAVAGVQP